MFKQTAFGRKVPEFLAPVHEIVNFQCLRRDLELRGKSSESRRRRRLFAFNDAVASDKETREIVSGLAKH